MQIRNRRVWRLLLLLILSSQSCWALEETAGERWNIVMITVDDMNWDSVGAYGSKVDGITPNIDRLASEGICFDRAHVTIAVCQPCRAVWLTGLYPHRNGAIGFNRIDRNVKTVPEALREAGYLTAVLGKTRHMLPSRKQAWEISVPRAELGQGRSPTAYFEQTKRAFSAAQDSGRPLFLAANTHDPHRPFAGSQQESRSLKQWEAQSEDSIEVRRVYEEDEIPVPGFLPDLAPIRTELAEYYTSVHRADESVGAILRAIDESGERESTVVLFLSDHGMPLPFAKTNCYFHSTKTPMIVRWPGKVQAGSRDDQHFVGGIDVVPTLLEWAGIESWQPMDGRSVVPILTGAAESDRNFVMTQFHKTSAGREYPMRALITAEGSYIFNGWADGEMRFRNESQSGLTMKAMIEAARQSPEINDRVELFLLRVPEEYYDLESDPDSLRNRVDESDYASQVRTHRQMLLKKMIEVNDPLVEDFERFLASQQP